MNSINEVLESVTDFAKPDLDFEYLNIIDTTKPSVTPPIWTIEVDLTFDEDEILEGDFVRYYNEDEKRYNIGRFLNLWGWTHEETSPYGDGRVMAYIETENGCTYADVTTITMADDRDDYGFIFTVEKVS
jgi:hypothetical protein